MNRQGLVGLLPSHSMLESAELTADWAAQDRPSVLQPSSLMGGGVKAMNRAAGFLEAVSIVLPELCPDLLDEFETFARRVESLFQATEAMPSVGSPGADARATIAGLGIAGSVTTAGATRWRWRSSAAPLPAAGRTRIGVPARSGSWPTAVGEQ